MKILNKFIINDLKLNKSRTINTIIGITISSALIFFVMCIFYSFKETFYRQTLNTTGNYYATFYNVSSDYKDNILNNESVTSKFYTQSVGYSEIENSNGKPYMYLMEFDKEALNNQGIKLIDGQLPSNSNEIIISEQINSKAGKNFKIGDKITLDVYRLKTNDNDELNQDYIYNKDSFKSMDFIKEEVLKKEYTIVGIIEKPNQHIETDSSSGYTVISLISELRDNVNISVKFKNPKETVDIVNSINQELGENAKKSIINYDLLSFLGVNQSYELIISSIFLIVITFLIIIVCSVVCIRSNLLLSLSEKVKQYSILLSIGAQRKQIKKCVFVESLILGVIGISLGLLIGVFSTLGIITIIDGVVKDIDFIFSTSFTAIIIGIILSFITVCISSMEPIKKISNISAIDGIKNSESIKVQANEYKTTNLKNILNVGGLISYKNFMRNKEKYQSTIVSLVVSIVLFIALGEFVNYAFEIFETQYGKTDYNISVSYKDIEDEDIKYDTFFSITNMDEVDSYTINRSLAMNADLLKYVDESNYSIYYKNLGVDEKYNIYIDSLGKDEYVRYINKLNKTYDECKNKVIFIQNNNTKVENNKKKVNLFNFNVGDKITGFIENESVELEIAEITNEVPMGFENIVNSSGFFIVSDELLESFNAKYDIKTLLINSSNPSSLCSQIENVSEKLLVVNREEEMEQDRQKLLIISIFLYLFIIVITLIGITNIINTINNTITQRSKEYAILKSIGMTNKEFNYMTNFESFFLCSESLIIGTILGIMLSFLIYIFANKIVELKFEFPIIEILISLLFLMLIVRKIMNRALKKILRKNIIDTIRSDNI